MVLVRKLLDELPTDQEALFLRGQIEIETRRYDESDGTANEIKRLHGDVAAYHILKGIIITDDPNQPKDRARLMRGRQHFKQAIARVEQPGLPSSLRMNLSYNLANAEHNLMSHSMAAAGDDRLELGQLLEFASEIARLFDEVIKESSDAAEAFVNKGNLLDETGRSLEALQCYTEALRVDPGHGMAIGNRGLALASLALQLPNPVADPCSTEAAFLLERGLKDRDFASSVAADSRLDGFIRAFLKRIGPNPPDGVVDHLVSHLLKTPRPPVLLGAIPEVRYADIAPMMTSALGLGLGFGTELSLRGEWSLEDWVDGKLTVESTRLSADETSHVMIRALLLRYVATRAGFLLSFFDLEVFKSINGLSTSKNEPPFFQAFLLKEAIAGAVDLLDTAAIVLGMLEGTPSEERSFAGSNSVFRQLGMMRRRKFSKSLMALAGLSLDLERGEYKAFVDWRNRITHRSLILQVNPSGENGAQDSTIRIARVSDAIQICLSALRMARFAILYLVLEVSDEWSEMSGGNA